jgi:hypothetical protein
MKTRRVRDLGAEIQVPASDVAADAEEAISLCDGDVRAALEATLVANAYLEAELEHVLEMVSAGYCRGKVRTNHGRAVKVEADALTAEFGDGAYEEARTRAREAPEPYDRHWDDVRIEIAKRTRRGTPVDTATRYLED